LAATFSKLWRISERRRPTGSKPDESFSFIRFEPFEGGKQSGGDRSYLG